MTKTKVLFVDDESSILAVIGTRIRSWGYDLIEADRGKRALELMKLEKPDIIILDYMMPEMNGVDTLREIRKIDKVIPVIMYTAYPDKQSIKDTEGLGIVAYIPKLSVHTEAQSALKTALSISEKLVNQKKHDSSVRKKRALIIDDEIDLIETLSFRLQANNYEVITSYNGEDGLEKAKNEKPDIVILDVMLPRMDGYKVCSILKNDPAYGNIPVIMLTAKAQESDKEFAKKYGADTYMVKPFDPQVLLETIKKLVR